MINTLENINPYKYSSEINSFVTEDGVIVTNSTFKAIGRIDYFDIDGIPTLILPTSTRTYLLVEIKVTEGDTKKKISISAKGPKEINSHRPTHKNPVGQIVVNHEIIVGTAANNDEVIDRLIAKHNSRTLLAS